MADEFTTRANGDGSNGDSPVAGGSKARNGGNGNDHDEDDAPGRLRGDPGFNFSTFFIRNPVTTLIMMLILVILGLASFRKMPLELFPNIEFPVVVISTVYPGAAPAEVETLVTKPIEEAVSSINGMDTLSSTSRDNVSTVICLLELGTSAKDAANDIRDKVSGVLYKLPKDTRPPTYSTFSGSSQPLAHYAITGPMSDVALSTYMKEVVKPRLEQVDGVAQILLTGNVERTFEVSLNPERLQAYSLSLPGVFMAVQSENYNLPGGMIDTSPRQLSVRTMGKFNGIDDLASLQIPTMGGGQVKLADLGVVRDTRKDRTTFAAIDGEDAIVFSVVKQTDANSVEVVEAVDRKLAELRPRLQRGVQVIKASDTSRFVKMSNEAVWEHLAIGACLAVLVLFVFLRNVTSMLISGLAIPLSIVMAFIPMQLFGFTFNNLTMLALSLVVGILVDDAVVDLENIYRHMENGEKPLRAAIKATGEIQLAVTATTLTIVGVFLPMSFMTGFVGIMFKSFGLTVTFAVLFSLLIARTLTPMLAAYLLRVKPRPGGGHAQGDLSGTYPKLLRWSLRHRWVVVAVATVTFIGGMSLVQFVQKSFISHADRSEFLLRVQLPRGSRLEDTIRVAGDVATRVKKFAGVDHVVTTIGAKGTLDDAQVDVLLVEKDKRKLSDEETAERVRESFKDYPGARVMADQMGMMGGGNKPIDIQLVGDDLGELKKYSEVLATKLAARHDLADIETSLGQERSELRIIPDRDRMAQYGVSAAALANTLRMATTGDTPNTISAGPQEIDVWVRVDPAFRADLDNLRTLMVQGTRGSVPLGAIAELEFAGGPAQIERRNRERMVHVTANLVPGVTVGTAMDVVKKEILPSLSLPNSVKIEMEGQAKQQRDVFAGFGQAMVMGVTLIYFILALQFGSFLHPLTIMFSLPLAVVGAFLGLIAFQKDLGMMSLIGIIMLMGIVTKNAILIVDFIQTMRARGYERLEAVLRGAQVRLRPILMTTAAMVLGMSPMAFSLGSGSEFRSPMAVVVIGGLLTSTALTLVVVPVMYTLLDDAKTWVLGRFRRRGTPAAGSPPGGEPEPEPVPAGAAG